MTRSILVYGDVNAAYRDGSRIWLESIIDVLGRTDSDVTLLLKAFPPPETERFGAGLDCRVLDPSTTHASRGAGMTVAEARARIMELDAEHRFDVVLTRGYRIAEELSTVPELAGRLWPYITDGPGFDPFGTGKHAGALARIARHARRVLVQTEDARSVWEACVPAATGKTLLLPPMVPDERFRAVDPAPEGGVPAESAEDGPLRLVYSGKFARAWKSLEIPSIPERLSARGVESRLAMIGDKIHHSPKDAPFPAEMQSVMETPRPHVEWVGGLNRDDALARVADADVGLGWRESGLDSSLEISTKLLEYSALGVAPVINRTRAHERLLGAGYPLFVDDDICKTLERAADARTRHAAARIARAAVEPHRASRCAERLESYFSSLEPDLQSSPPFPRPEHGGPLRVLFSSHDFKFAGELIDVLEQRDDVELRIDTWSRLAHHDAAASSADGEWADVILCEWAGHNAVFHSRRKRPDQRLIVRFHGFEIRGAWLKDIDIDAVDAFVFVSDFYRREILEKTGWPESMTTVIPNVVDVVDLDREKLPGAEFHLGLAGYVPMLKRPDRALDVLERLVTEDERFMLHLRGRAPWSYPWEWAKPLQRNAYEALLDRVRTSPTLRSNVQFEEFGPDMGSWFRGIGWVLSPSVKETFHLAPVEGMASGAVPLVWSRPGASEIFGEALFESVDQVVASVLRTVSTPGAFDELSRTATELARSFDMSEHRQAWLDLLDPARSTPLPLRGRPLVSTVPPEGPQNAAQAAAVLDHALTGEDLSSAVDVMSSSTVVADDGSHLQARITDLRGSVLLLDGLRRGRWIPTHSLGPVYRPVLSAAVAPGAGRLDTSEVLGSVALNAEAVLVAADALTTAARRERPSRLLAPDDAGGLIATAIAARRLGIELEESEAGRAALALADDELPGISRAYLEAMDRSAPARDLAELTIGLIADRFTDRAVSAAVHTIRIPRTGWEEVLENTRVDLVLVESTWSAPGEDWFHGVAYHGEQEASDLRAILAFARERGTPTLFWNREDPVHLRSFRAPAADFDAVLTSDATCIPTYLRTLPSRTTVAASMPFFADPRTMHPAAGGPTDADSVPIAFAGTYYGDRYKDRTRELRGILTAAAEHGLAVYDRQANLESSPYRLPDDLQEYSRGGVPAERMPDVYRQHPIHLNVNSVTSSPTMFSRRVVEIASSGSVVLSGQGEGVRTVLGPAFPVLADAEKWRTTLASVTSDATKWRRMAWDQLRTVRRSFTSSQSLTLAFRIAGLQVRSPSAPRYGVLVPASFDGASTLLLAQTIPPSAVAIPPGHPDRAAFVAAGITVVDLEEAAADLGSVIDEDGYVGVLAAGISPTHYEDLLLAADFGDWDCLIARNDPASTDEEFSLVSATPPSGKILGALYSRRIAKNARDLASASQERAFVWIRDAGGVTHPTGGI